MKEQIICRVLTGPTGSGKSEIAMQLAEENGWVILCMDSMQIYRRMDIGTAKPTPAERKKVPHYLLDLCEPDESFSVSRYIEAAEQCVREQHETGKEVLFVGGTGRVELRGVIDGGSHLYVDAAGGLDFAGEWRSKGNMIVSGCDQ